MNRIKELRKKHHMKQTELCKLLNIVQGTLSGWETGKYEPDIASLMKMSEIFNESIDYILTGRVVPITEKSTHLPIYKLGVKPSGDDILGYVEYSTSSDDEIFCALIDDDNFHITTEKNDVFILRKTDKISENLPVIIKKDTAYYLCRRAVGISGTMLVSNNFNYPLIFSFNDIKNNLAEIIGEVIEIRKHFK